MCHRTVTTMIQDGSKIQLQNYIGDLRDLAYNCNFPHGVITEYKRICRKWVFPQPSMRNFKDFHYCIFLKHQPLLLQSGWQAPILGADQKGRHCQNLYPPYLPQHDFLSVQKIMIRILGLDTLKTVYNARFPRMFGKNSSGFSGLLRIY